MGNPHVIFSIFKSLTKTRDPQQAVHEAYVLLSGTNKYSVSWINVSFRNSDWLLMTSWEFLGATEGKNTTQESLASRRFLKP